MTHESSPVFLYRDVRRVPADWKHPTGPNEYSADTTGAKELHFLPYDLMKLRGHDVLPDECMPRWSREEATHIQLYFNGYAGIPLSPVFELEADLAEWIASHPRLSSDSSARPGFAEWLAFIRNQLKSTDSVLWPEPSEVLAKQTNGLCFLAVNDSHTRVFVNGAEIGQLTFDELGWSGMDTSRQLLISMAKSLGMPVQSL